MLCCFNGKSENWTQDEKIANFGVVIHFEDSMNTTHIEQRNSEVEKQLKRLNLTEESWSWKTYFDHIVRASNEIIKVEEEILGWQFSALIWLLLLDGIWWTPDVECWCWSEFQMPRIWNRIPDHDTKMRGWEVIQKFCVNFLNELVRRQKESISTKNDLHSFNKMWKFWNELSSEFLNNTSTV